MASGLKQVLGCDKAGRVEDSHNHDGNYSHDGNRDQYQ